MPRRKNANAMKKEIDRLYSRKTAAPSVANQLSMASAQQDPTDDSSPFSMRGN
jgi:hypothetical protein